MCKPIFWIFTWLLFYTCCAQTFSKCSEYINLYYIDTDRFEKSDFYSHNGDGLMQLEVLSLMLAGTGLLLMYLQFKEKTLLCIWIIFFVLAEIGIFFLTILGASQKMDRYSFLHIIHTGLAIYTLALVYGKSRNVTYCCIKDKTCQVEQGELSK